jgi:hypothetical protein
MDKTSRTNETGLYSTELWAFPRVWFVLLLCSCRSVTPLVWSWLRLQLRALCDQLQSEWTLWCKIQNQTAHPARELLHMFRKFEIAPVCRTCNFQIGHTCLIVQSTCLVRWTDRQTDGRIVGKKINTASSQTQTRRDWMMDEHTDTGTWVGKVRQPHNTKQRRLVGRAGIVLTYSLLRH